MVEIHVVPHSARMLQLREISTLPGQHPRLLLHKGHIHLASGQLLVRLQWERRLQYGALHLQEWLLRGGVRV